MAGGCMAGVCAARTIVDHHYSCPPIHAYMAGSGGASAVQPAAHAWFHACILAVVVVRTSSYALLAARLVVAARAWWWLARWAGGGVHVRSSTPPTDGRFERSDTLRAESIVTARGGAHS